MERRPRCGAAVCDYAPPPGENQSTDYTLAARCGPGLTDSVVRVDWHSNGNGENLQFLPFYVKRRSPSDHQGFHFTVGFPWNVETILRWAPIVLFIRFFQIYRQPCKTLRDTKILFTLISASALMETLITVLHSVGLLWRPHAGQRWPTFKQ